MLGQIKSTAGVVSLPLIRIDRNVAIKVNVSESKSIGRELQSLRDFVVDSTRR